jgi:hypothetical protein
MYRSDSVSCELFSPVSNGRTSCRTSRSRVPPPRHSDAKGAVLARSPLEAMQMAETSESSEFFPTVTITLTTLLWPGTAH